ncbi:hypothetical protein SYNTR_0707 [Candidatus Syntrophocurvum alkaliphilum]|uniref:Uncharacterized protein n=1 Tax=Candidatus Syntrophocurvum alkaliphilum TaxID=2293317 RepID=A0A6I6DFU8_9FIRM|nr:hypothetical protein [Candidatus Syntrophocurvum alkaliphilum]QGT99300.1 hypothetical protein SYNTR_0707 [Candidatus Syntrophocurvum alkaliphilum]
MHSNLYRRLKKLENQLKDLGVASIIILAKVENDDWIFEEQEFIDETNKAFEIYLCSENIKPLVNTCKSLKELRQMAYKKHWNLNVLPADTPLSIEELWQDELEVMQ